jgi:hypothetical protein
MSPENPDAMALIVSQPSVASSRPLPFGVIAEQDAGIVADPLRDGMNRNARVEQRGTNCHFIRKRLRSARPSRKHQHRAGYRLDALTAADVLSANHWPRRGDFFGQLMIVAINGLFAI